MSDVGIRGMLKVTRWGGVAVASLASASCRMAAAALRRLVQNFGRGMTYPDVAFHEMENLEIHHDTSDFVGACW